MSKMKELDFDVNQNHEKVLSAKRLIFFFSARFWGEISSCLKKDQSLNKHKIGSYK